MNVCKCEKLTSITVAAPGPLWCTHCDMNINMDDFHMSSSLKAEFEQWCDAYGMWIDWETGKATENGLELEVAHNVQGRGLRGALAKQFPQFDILFSPSMCEQTALPVAQKTTLSAYINIVGNDDFPLQDVTARLRITPTTTQKRGEPVREDASRTYFVTSWMYEVGPIEALHSDDVLDPLYTLFGSKVEVLNALKKAHNVTISINVVMHIMNGEVQGLTISRPFNEFATSIDALIDVDMYVFPFQEEA